MLLGMRRGLISVLAIVALVMGLTTAAKGVQVCLRTSCSGLPAPTFGGGVSPRKLPRNEYVPITARLFGKVKTSDETHPSALREAIVDVDKDIRVNAKGLPVCEAHPYVREAGRWLERVCHSSIIGRGEARFEIAFPEQQPIKLESPLFILNGGEKSGEVTLVIITSISVPAPTEIVITVTITRKGSGIHAIAEVPVIAGGSGSLLGFDFRLGKTYKYHGRKLGYLEAKCPDEVFKVNVPSLLFKNETHEPGVPAATVFKGGWTVPCTPVG